MRGKSDEEILAERNRIILKAQDALGEAVDPLPSFFTVPAKEHENAPVHYLANSVYILAEADAAVFAKGWEEARGCRIEHEICLAYGIDIVEVYSD